MRRSKIKAQHWRRTIDNTSDGNFNYSERFSLRILTGIWLLCILILASSYCGQLISFLTRVTFDRVPRTNNELAEAVSTGKYSCGIIKSTSYTYYIINAKSGSIKIIGDHIKAKKNYFSYEEAFNKVLSENFAYIGVEKDLRHFSEKLGSINFVISEDTMGAFTRAYLLKKSFRYKKEINKIISRYFEAGLTEREKDLHEFSKDISISKEMALTIESLLSPLLLLLVGYALSSICLIAEIILFKKIHLFSNRD